MHHNTDTLYSTVIGGSSSALAYLVGGVDHLITALGMFMAIDYLMGLMIAVSNKTLSSEVGFKGLMKKTGMILAVIVAVQLDLISGSGGQFMRNTMIMFLIGMEGISILENLGHLGVKVPQQISNVFAQLKEENEKTAAPAVKATTETRNEPEEQERDVK